MSDSSWADVNLAQHQEQMAFQLGSLSSLSFFFFFLIIFCSIFGESHRNSIISHFSQPNHHEPETLTAVFNMWWWWTCTQLHMSVYSLHSQPNGNQGFCGVFATHCCKLSSGLLSISLCFGLDHKNLQYRLLPTRIISTTLLFSVKNNTYCRLHVCLSSTPTFYYYRH